jgi:hypothetical protein
VIAIPTVISLRFEKCGEPVGYLMVQTNSVATAQRQLFFRTAEE